MGEVSMLEQNEGNFQNSPLRELHFRLEFIIITATGEFQEHPSQYKKGEASHFVLNG
jgi:hypothetical protein